MLNVLVLAAGKSTRLEARTGGRPKPLIEVRGDSLIGWNLRWLAASGVRDVWINLHYRAEEVRATLGTGTKYSLKFHFSYEREILGTAGGWRNCASKTGGRWLVVYGDNLTRFDLRRFMAFHRQWGFPATVAVFDPNRHLHTGLAGGRVRVGDDLRVREFTEGADSSAEGLVNAGVYLLEPQVLNWVDEGFQDFGKDVLPRGVVEGAVGGYVLEDGAFCLGLDTPEGFDTALTLLETQAIELS